MNSLKSARPPDALRHRPEHVFGLLERLKLRWLLAHLRPNIVWASYLFVNGFATIGVLALLAFITHNPFVFPSLGPTAYLFFFTPLAETASPRNAVLGHAIALCCGFAAFWVTGMNNLPAGFPTEIYCPRVLSAALSLSFTGAIMVLLHVSHPPAGATTMIVSLGIIAKPKYLFIIEAAVILLTAQAFLINRLAGLPYPAWKKAESASLT